MRGTDKDYYEILGVPRNATIDEIKAAYRRLAKKYHPDVAENKEEAERIFREINEAYQVLSDPEKRRLYDMYGKSAFTNNYQTSSSGSHSYGYSWDPFGDVFSDAFSEMLFDFIESVFSSSFTGSRSRKAYTPDFSYMTKEDIFQYLKSKLPPIHGEPINLKVKVTLEEVLSGTKKKLTYKRKVRCPVCGGVGFSPDAIEICPTCKGRGVITTRKVTPFGTIVTESRCPECGGSGVTLKSLCPRCKGQRFIDEKEEIEVEIPPGVKDGDLIEIPGKGDEGALGGEDGSLLVRVEYEPHPIFKVRWPNLVLDLTISYPEAVLGTSLEVPTIDGGYVTVKIPPRTHHGDEIRIPEKGLPKGKNQRARGDLIIKVQIDIPDKLSQDQRKLLEKMRELFLPKRRHPAIKTQGNRSKKGFFNWLRRS